MLSTRTRPLASTFPTFYNRSFIYYFILFLGLERRAVQHIRHLLDSIAQFPQGNPSQLSSDFDVSKLQRQIRSRYKALCACLGVRPRMHLAASSPPPPSTPTTPLPTEAEADLQIDDHDHDDERHPASRAGSTRIVHDRAPVAPGSAIPVWKIDGKSGLKSAVTNMDLTF